MYKLLLVHYLVLLFAIKCINCEEINEKGELIFAHVIYRHGDRTPVEPYPTDPWKNRSFWPVDFGQLTNTGKQQHYQLGQWLSNRYKNFLSEYTNDLVYVQSTDIDRTIMSALSNIAGMFPPYPDQKWNPSLNWQPIPVHTIPESIDYVLAAKCPCPLYDWALKKYENSPEMKRLNAKYKPLYDYLTENSGQKVDTFTKVEYLYNTLTIETLYNKTLPEWTKKVFPGGEMESISNRKFAISTNTPQLARLKSGFLIKEILVRFQNRSRSDDVIPQSLYVYSAHDNTISGVLNSLGLFEPHSPPYAACIMMELRRYNNTPYVQIFYKNTTETPKPMNIPNCGDFCPLDKIFQLYSDILPDKSFDAECKLEPMMLSYAEDNLGTVKGAIIAGLAFSMLALVIFGVVAVYRRRNYPNQKWYMEINS